MKREIILKLGLVLLFWLFHLGMHAEDVKSITFLVNGKPVMFNLADNPVITYSNDCLVIVTNKTTIEINVGEIESAGFTEVDATGIRDVTLGKISLLDGTATFFQLKPGSMVRVYNTSGEQLLEEQASSEGRATIEMMSHSEGVYIIKTETQTIKIINK